jgi:hypothetical protein
MAANLLNSKKAVETSIFVVRTFVKLREFAITYKDLAKKINDIEKKISGQDKTIASIVITLKRLIEKPQTEPKKREIGFTAKHGDN